MTDRPRPAGEILDSALALTSDGVLLIGLEYATVGDVTVEVVARAIVEALDEGSDVLVGVALAGRDRRLAAELIANAAADVAGQVGGDRRRRRASRGP
ncbi:MAG: hypothetical protein ACHREM_11430 [Polyangiales bacterium]